MQSASIAALEWKILHPEENRGRPRKGKKKTPKTGFLDFAKDNHGVGKDYAEKALAVAKGKQRNGAHCGHQLKTAGAITTGERGRREVRATIARTWKPPT